MQNLRFRSQNNRDAISDKIARSAIPFSGNVNVPKMWIPYSFLFNHAAVKRTKKVHNKNHSSEPRTAGRTNPAHVPQQRRDNVAQTP